MVAENITTNSDESIDSVAPIDPNTTTYGNLGEQVEFDPEKAEKLRRGEQVGETQEINPDSPEPQPDEAEPITTETQPINGQEQERPQEPEKTRTEKQLDSAKERLERINQELEDTKSNKERLEEEISAIEFAIEDNIEEHDKLSEKAQELKLEINKTKRSIIGGFTNGLKIAKNLMLGKHDEARKILGEIGGNIDANEKAMTEQKENDLAIENNEREQADLDKNHKDTIDEHSLCVDKISRLERQKSEASKQIEILKQEVADQAWAAAWEDAQEGIKAEMGTDNMTAFRQELNSQRQELDDELEEDLNELSSYKNPSRIQRLMRTEDELRRDAERADEIERMLKEQHDNATATLDAKREKVDKYFPTWQERIKNVKENHLVKGALSTLKRKILMRRMGMA